MNIPQGWNTVLASGARTATHNLDVTAPSWAKGVMVGVHLTAVSSTPSVTPAIRYKLAGTDNYETVCTGGALTTADTHDFMAVYPATMSASGFSNIVVTQLPMTPVINLLFTHGDTDSATYVAYVYWLK